MLSLIVSPATLSSSSWGITMHSCARWEVISFQQVMDLHQGLLLVQGKISQRRCPAGILTTTTDSFSHREAVTLVWAPSRCLLTLSLRVSPGAIWRKIIHPLLFATLPRSRDHSWGLKCKRTGKWKASPVGSKLSSAAILTDQLTSEPAQAYMAQLLPFYTSNWQITYGALSLSCCSTVHLHPSRSYTTWLNQCLFKVTPSKNMCLLGVVFCSNCISCTILISKIYNRSYK